MYNLLIVDDEVFIADGLYRLFLKQTELSLEVYRTYSAKEALALLCKYRIDIIITDIQMPGMNGLDMIHEIKHICPNCHIIILTGYSEFDYARRAIHLGADYYLLKIQGDEPLIDAVVECTEKIKKESSEIEWIQKTENELKKAKPVLRQELLFSLLKNSSDTYESLNERFADLDIPINPDQPFHLVAARLDNLSDQLNNTPISHYSTAINVIFNECTSAKAQSVQILLLNQRYMIWLIQPLEGYNMNDLFHYVRSMLDRIQELCSYVLSISVSFIIEPEPIVLKDLPDYYHKIKYILTHQLSRHEELLLGDTAFFDNKTYDQTQIQQLLESFSTLGQYLEVQDKEKFLSLFSSLLSQMFDIEAPQVQLTVYHNLCTLLINHIISCGKYSDFMQEFHDLSAFSTPFESWDIDLYEFLLKVADWFFQIDENEKNQRYNQMVSVIHNYIEQHLSEDITLPILAEQVFLNPVYLSRSYEQITGQNISRYIADCRINKAKDMLTSTSMKINEITYAIGYESPAHLSRLFKKATSFTPQEYRDNFFKLE